MPIWHAPFTCIGPLHSVPRGVVSTVFWPSAPLCINVMPRRWEETRMTASRVRIGFFFYVLFRVLSWWRSYCIQGMRPRYVVWKLRVFNRPNQRGHPRAVSLTPAGLSELFLLYGLLNGITNSAWGRVNSRWRGATDHSKLPTGHSCCLNSQRGGSERSSSVACQTQE